MSKIITDSIRTYLLEIGRYPLLTHEEEIDLATTIAAGIGPRPYRVKIAAQQAKKKFIRSNLRLVVNIAKKYQHRGMDLILGTESNAEDDLYQQQVAEKLRSAMQCLTDRERQALAMRHGLGGRSEMTLAKVGIELSLSRERIRQIHAKAERKLRSKKNKNLLSGLLA